MGYGVANASIIKALEPAREPFNVNSFGQALAASGNRGSGFCRRMSNEKSTGFESILPFLRTA